MHRKQRRKEERKEKNKVVEDPQSFQMSYHLHRPWSDIILETHLPPMILEKMIKLSDEVKKQFDYSIKAVQELFDAAKKIDSSLT